MPKNRNTIGNQTCDLSACSAVLQPTAPLCVPSTCKSTRKYSPKFALKQEVLLWTSAQNVLALLLQKTADSFASYESVPHPWWFVSAMYKAAHNIPTTIILISVSTFTYTSTSWNERDYELWRFSSYGSWELVNEYFLTFHRPTVPASSRSSSPKLVVFRHIKLKKKTVLYIYIYIYTECPRRNVPDFGRVFLMLKYTDTTQNTYVQSWTVTEIMAREVWNFDSCYTLMIAKFILKLAGICGFCNVNICT